MAQAGPVGCRAGFCVYSDLGHDSWVAIPTAPHLSLKVLLLLALARFWGEALLGTQRYVLWCFPWLSQEEGEQTRRKSDRAEREVLNKVTRTQVGDVAG